MGNTFTGGITAITMDLAELDYQRLDILKGYIDEQKFDELETELHIESLSEAHEDFVLIDAICEMLEEVGTDQALALAKRIQLVLANNTAYQEDYYPISNKIRRYNLSTRISALQESTDSPEKQAETRKVIMQLLLSEYHMLSTLRGRYATSVIQLSELLNEYEGTADPSFLNDINDAKDFVKTSENHDYRSDAEEAEEDLLGLLLELDNSDSTCETKNPSSNNLREKIEKLITLIMKQRQELQDKTEKARQHSKKIAKKYIMQLAFIGNRNAKQRLDNLTSSLGPENAELLAEANQAYDVFNRRIIYLVKAYNNIKKHFSKQPDLIDRIRIIASKIKEALSEFDAKLEELESESAAKLEELKSEYDRQIKGKKNRPSRIQELARIAVAAVGLLTLSAPFINSSNCHNDLEDNIEHVSADNATGDNTASEQIEPESNSVNDNLVSHTAEPEAANPASHYEQPEPEQVQVEDNTQEVQAQVLPTRPIEGESSLTESQVAFRLPIGSFDASTMTNPEIANSEASAIGSMESREFRNNAVHTLRSDIQGPTEFVVATINDRHIVRSATGQVTPLRLNRGETFTATPLQDEYGNQIYGHLEGIGYMPLAQLEGTSYVIFLSPYTQTVTLTAAVDITPELDQQNPITFDEAETESAANDYTPDPNQSLEDFIQDLFADELASQPTLDADPELASMIDQSADQIQMPEPEPVIPEWYYESRSKQAIEADDELGFVVEDKYILSAEDLYEEVDDSDIIDEEYVLDETDLEEVFTVDSKLDTAPLLDANVLELEEVKAHDSATFQPIVIPQKPLRQPEQTKGFLSRTKNFLKGLFRS